MARSAKGQAGTAEDSTVAFFEALEKVGHRPLLQRTSGTLRFDLVEGGRTRHWRVSVDKGDVTVTHGRAAAADSVVRADKSLFDGMVTGRVNATAAMLRGALEADGDIGLLLSFQRLFPSPPRARTGRSGADARRSTS